MNLFNIVYGLLIITVVLVSVGVGIVSLLFPRIQHVEKIIIGTVISTSLLASNLFLVGRVTGAISNIILLAYFIIGLYFLPYTVQAIKATIKRIIYFPWLSGFAFLSSLSLASTVMFSWIWHKGALVFQNGVIHDSVWHIALSRQILKQIPPEHPSAFNQTVTEYHYLFDILIAGLSKFGISLTVVFYQIMPLFTALLLAGTALLFIRKITKANIVSQYTLLFSLFFVGSFAYFIPLLGLESEWSESSFWVSQTFNVMINPQLILSFAIVFVVLNLLYDDFHWNCMTKRRVYRNILISFLIASSLGFKSYAFPILSLLYGFYLLILLLQKKAYSLWFATIFLLFSLPFIFSFVNFNDSTFIWMPLWFPRTMFEAQDRLFYPNMILLEEHLRSQGMIFKLFLLKSLWVAIFYIGNLGIRSLIVFLPAFLFIKDFRKKFNSPVVFLVGLGFLISTIVPLLVIQKGVVWNSIQFWYYGLIFADILLAVLLGYIYDVFFRNKKKLFFALLLVLVILSIPTYIQTMQVKFTKPKIISKPEIDQILEISEYNRVMICKEEGEFFYQTSLVSALTGSSIYFADPDQVAIFNVSSDEYKFQLKRIFADKDPHVTEETVKAEGIDYIVCNDKNWYNIFAGLLCVDPRTNKDERELYSLKVLPYCPIDSSLYLK